ncbi:OLC1v1025296C1 [Oldenlandia corymbosa var. corymbosa]|uniref:OLC1v1025296C1 n=1 Tax=Oldenlandia corymbosa var. corymbosa TaxID=529605 RepID=A0AAV1C4H0_OLDCO|nr:OLC1v1025296C1 [Oldenlandia corymbosa var. corymbosa]
MAELLLVACLKAYNLVENLLEDFEFEVQVPDLLYHNTAQEVNGTWFYNAHESEQSTSKRKSTSRRMAYDVLDDIWLKCVESGILISISEAEEKLRVEGAWNGVLELNLEEWKVPMLREEVAKQSGYSDGPQMINLTSSSKVLKDVDGTEKLSQLGLRNNCKVMATKISVDQGKLKQEFLAKEERYFNLELENQRWETVKLGSIQTSQVYRLVFAFFDYNDQLTCGDRGIEAATVGSERGKALIPSEWRNDDRIDEMLSCNGPMSHLVRYSGWMNAECSGSKSIKRSCSGSKSTQGHISVVDPLQSGGCLAQGSSSVTKSKDLSTYTLVGETARSEKKAYGSYNDHARLISFSVRIEKQNLEGCGARSSIDNDRNGKAVDGPLLWKALIMRRLSDLLYASEYNKDAKKCCDEVVDRLKEELGSFIGPTNNDEECVDNDGAIKNPVVKKKKIGPRNERPKSIIEKACNKVRGRKNNARIVAN